MSTCVPQTPEAVCAKLDEFENALQEYIKARPEHRREAEIAWTSALLFAQWTVGNDTADVDGLIDNIRRAARE